MVIKLSVETKEHPILAPTYLAVLSIIASGAKYGYEINKILKERGFRNWVDIKMSSVYKALDELEKMGLLRGKKADSAVRPSKKTFSITKKGKKALERDLLRCLSNPPPTFTMFDLGLAGFAFLNKDSVLEALRNYVTLLDEHIDFLEKNVKMLRGIGQGKSIPKDERAPVSTIDDLSHLGVVTALFDRPMTMMKTQKKWILSILKDIERNPRLYTFRSKQ